MVLKNLRLSVDDACIIIESDFSNKKIFIDRSTQNISFKSDFSSSASPRPIFGIWGLIKFISGYYLIVIDSVVPCGNFLEHEIFRIDKSSIIRVATNLNNLLSPQLIDEEYYLNLLQDSLNDSSYYFSYTLDLTKSLQKSNQSNSTKDDLFTSIIPHFAWNYYLFAELDKHLGVDCREYFFPIINGFFKNLKNLNDSVNAKSQQNYYLISRRNVNRVGPRYLCRGIDENGNVANFVETEQVVQLEKDRFSFVQIRGSIPLLWNQDRNIKYSPPIRLNEGVEIVNQKRIFRKHFDKLNFLQGYGKSICLNLINSHGDEGRLADTFTEISHEFDSEELGYIHYDFHKECGSNRWHRLSELIDKLSEDFKKIGIYHQSLNNGTWTVIDRQKNVFRTNCIDCLDRTNVVQSLLAKRMLYQSLIETKILENEVDARHHQGEEFEKFWPNFEEKFRNLWADHADAISIHYSGTPALKTDFTRTGKRTTLGKLNDGYNSLKRYVLNNFYDGAKQDSLNLLLGHFRCTSRDGSSQPTLSKHLHERSTKRKVLPLFLLVTLSLTALSIIFPDDDLFKKLKRVFFFGASTIAALFIIVKSPDEFLNQPILPVLLADENKKD